MKNQQHTTAVHVACGHVVVRKRKHALLNFSYGLRRNRRKRSFGEDQTFSFFNVLSVENDLNGRTGGCHHALRESLLRLHHHLAAFQVTELMQCKSSLMKELWACWLLGWWGALGAPKPARGRACLAPAHSLLAGPHICTCEQGSDPTCSACCFLSLWVKEEKP